MLSPDLADLPLPLQLSRPRVLLLLRKCAPRGISNWGRLFLVLEVQQAAPRWPFITLPDLPQWSVGTWGPGRGTRTGKHIPPLPPVAELLWEVTLEE